MTYEELWNELKDNLRKEIENMKTAGNNFDESEEIILAGSIKIVETILRKMKQLEIIGDLESQIEKLS